MRLSEHRTLRRMTLAEAARQLGICGINPGATLVRIENGSRQPDADMIERIERWSGGAVTAADMHAVRLSWLKANRPEKFAGHAPTAPSQPDRLPTADCRLPDAAAARAIAEAAE